MAQENKVVAEVFPICTNALPQLSAYVLQANHGDLATMGGKLAYRLQKQFGGHWIWTTQRLVTDTPQSEATLQAALEKVWQQDSKTFRGLLSIQPDVQWQPTAQVRADFVARGLWPDLQPQVNNALAPLGRDLGKIKVHRVCTPRGWVIGNQPALSLSVASRLIAKQDLKTYVSHLADVTEIIGMIVEAKHLGFKGEIDGIMQGTAAQHRTRLLSIAQNESSKKLLQQAADDELVVRVRVGNKEPYEMVVSALQIVVRTADYTKFQVNAQHATQTLRLSPKDRSAMISNVSVLGRQKKLITSVYSSSSFPERFLQAQDVGFTCDLLIGGGQHVTEPGLLQAGLCTHGLYRRADRFPAGTPLRIGVLNGLPETNVSGFLSLLQKELLKMKFTCQISRPAAVRHTSRDMLEKGIHAFQQKSCDLLLAFLPDADDAHADEQPLWDGYHHFKSLTVGLGIPSQVVNASTLDNTRYALTNIALAILSKVGNIPYMLAHPLPYADIVVGIDVARRKKERLAGTMNATALTRIYQNTGEFLQYALHDAPLEGETLPTHVLHALFPHRLFAGKRVLIQRDGLFRGNEVADLQAWAEKLDAQFLCMEIMKTGTPRLYGLGETKDDVFQPSKGSALKLNEHEAFVVSSLPPFATVTPSPLHIRSRAPFPIEDAIHSVLALTLLHYGSLRPPRLPVPIHYSDEIAYLALHGIKPRELEGNLPFWL